MAPGINTNSKEEDHTCDGVCHNRGGLGLSTTRPRLSPEGGVPSGGQQVVHDQGDEQAERQANDHLQGEEAHPDVVQTAAKSTSTVAGLTRPFSGQQPRKALLEAPTSSAKIILLLTVCPPKRSENFACKMLPPKPRKKIVQTT